MTVQECYEQAGADFQDAMNRLGSEALIKRFARICRQGLRKRMLKKHSAPHIP